MRRSIERILTTHGGSLPRPGDLLELVAAKQRGDSYDAAVLAERVEQAVAEAVARQVETGIDVVSDGELSKPGFTPYVVERLGGFESWERRPGEGPPLWRDLAEFPDYARSVGISQPGGTRLDACTGPIIWRGDSQIQADIANLRVALAGQQVEEAFMPAASPGVIAHNRPNRYYNSDTDYLFAVADAMRNEYKAITNAGFLLQLDAPDIPDERHRTMADASPQEYMEWVETRIGAINHALHGVPQDRVRFHVCWGNYEGPHHRDVPLRDIVDLLLQVHAGALYVEASNPRHAHEWQLWRSVSLPADMVLIPGVIDTTTNFIEHPELVAERITRFAGLVGQENVIAATDCGFGTYAGGSRVHASIAWAKLGALAEGAAIASRELWGR